MVKPFASVLRTRPMTYGSPSPNPASGPLRGLMKPTLSVSAALAVRHSAGTALARAAPLAIAIARLVISRRVRLPWMIADPLGACGGVLVDISITLLSGNCSSAPCGAVAAVAATSLSDQLRRQQRSSVHSPPRALL